MSDNIVTPKPSRRIRWWPLIAAVLVLATNAWLEHRGAPLMGVFNWYKHFYVHDDDSDFGFGVKIPPVLSGLLVTDQDWRDVAFSLEADRSPEKVLREASNKPIELRNWTRARFLHRLPKEPQPRIALLTTYMADDPANALYPMMLANEAFREAGLDADKIKTKTWSGTTITRPTELPQALSYAQKALSSPILSDYTTEYERHRMRNIKPPYLTEHQLARIEVSSESLHPMLSYQRTFAKNYGAMMVYLARNGQVKQADQLSRSWQKAIFRHKQGTLNAVIDVMVYKACISILSSATAEVAKIAGDTTRAQRYSGYVQEMKNRQQTNDYESDSIISRHGGILSSIMLPPNVKITQQNIEPLRTAEQAVFERIVANSLSIFVGGILVALLLCCAFLAGSGWQYSRKDLGIAAALAVMPWAVYGLLLLVPNLMSRQYGPGVAQTSFVVQLAVTTVLCLILPVWWLSRRMGTLTKRPHFMVFVGLLVLLLALGSLACYSALFTLALAVVLLLTARSLARKEWLFEWTRGLAVSMAVLWLVLGFVAYPMFTAKDAAAWSRDTLLFSPNDEVSPAEREVMKLYDRSIMLPAAKYGLLKDAGR